MSFYSFQKNLIFVLIFPLISFGTRGPDRTAVNHKTKECVVFHIGGICSSCDPMPKKKKWIEETACPKGYKYLGKDLEEKKKKLVALFKKAFQFEFVTSPEKPKLKNEHKTVVNHKTKTCIVQELRLSLSEVPDKGWKYMKYTLREGWVYIKSCPSSYTSYDEKKFSANYLEREKETIKCEPRSVPKCCTEEPFCI